MNGATIRQRLSQVGTTQTELARLLEVTPQAVSSILSAIDVRTGTVERISEALHLPVSFFYDEPEEEVTHNLEQEKTKGERMKKIWKTNRIGEKVRALLHEQHKKLIELCEYVGMTDPGMRKVFDRDSCNISALQKMAEYFHVPVSYFLPENHPYNTESEKDREIEYLRGQVKAYETALALLSKGKENNESYLIEGK